MDHFETARPPSWIRCLQAPTGRLVKHGRAVIRMPVELDRPVFSSCRSISQAAACARLAAGRAGPRHHARSGRRRQAPPHGHVLAPQRVEVRRPVLSGNHDLGIDQERVRLKASGGFDNGREAVGPVIAVAGEATDPRPSRRTIKPVAVVFDFVNPQRTGRRSGYLRRQAGFDEAGGTHGRRIGQRPRVSTTPVKAAT